MEVNFLGCCLPESIRLNIVKKWYNLFKIIIINFEHVNTKENIMRIMFSDASVWMKSGQKLLEDEVKRQRFERVDKEAKNVIKN